MRGFKPGAHSAKRQKHTGGGRVRGPGTGTSDSIQTSVPDGSYIMPADSSQAIGEQNLDAIGTPSVPVNLSNGEHHLPPEQVHAIGAQALDQMKNATHTPTGNPALGFNPGQEEEPPLFFADGGLVDERKKNTGLSASGRGVAPSPGSAAPDAAMRNPAAGRAQLPPPNKGAAPLGLPKPSPVTPGASTSTPPPSAQQAIPKAAPASAAPKPPLYNAKPEAKAGGATGFNPRAEKYRMDPRYTAQDQARAYTKADSAKWRADQAAQDKAFQEAKVKPSTTNAGKLAKARGFVNKAGQGNALTGMALATMGGFEDDATERYSKRFGFNEPKYDGSIGDASKYALLRGLGYASDVGSVATFGMADKLYRDKQEVDTEQAGGSAGMLAGSYGGSQAGKWAGKAIDGIGRLATRGRYKGQAAENLLNNKATRGAGSLAGGFYGSGVGSDIGRPGEVENIESEAVPSATSQEVPLTPQPPTEFASANPRQAPTIDDGQQWSPAAVDGAYSRVNDDGVTEFTDQAGVNGRGFNNAGRSAQNEQAVQALFNRTPELGEGGAQVPQQQPGNRGFNAGGSRVRLIRDASREDAERTKAFDEVNRLIPGARGITASQRRSRNQLLEGSAGRSADLQREVISQQGQNNRADMREAGANYRDAQQNQTDQQRLAGEGQERGFRVRAAQRVENLQKQLAEAPPEQRGAIAEQLRILRGDEAPARFATASGGQAYDPNTMQMIKQPDVVYDRTTGRPIDQGGIQLPPIEQNPAVQKIMQDTRLSRKERAQQIRELGYE